MPRTTVKTKDPRGGWRSGKSMKTAQCKGKSTTRLIRRLAKQEARDATRAE